ncbi:Threonylcarbamoyl-AMP synthase [Planctomycetes bacterium Pla163]|uniref:L-threonylcarbamoyladenylate synthase n=1 Tax=Rohdeia mirabilis TaxID=2528008 RepID=A0A518CZV4_9BACT|nr:Threonylcarbamoyl-AMP synthase [Planctomycetes bacterium Pla163]
MPDAIEPVPLPDTGPIDPDVVRALVTALATGGVVGIPTETVYGLAVRADDEAAVKRLLATKGSAQQRALTWHVPDAGALADWSGFTARARRLAARYWPGPLTMVLDGAPEGLEPLASAAGSGVRVPAHGGARALLAACPFPVVVSSANRSGAAPLLDAASVAAEFGAELAGLGDGGTARSGEASTVLAIGTGRFEVLREGLLSRVELVRTAGRRIAFVCTGNTCRSPMAETLAADKLRRALGIGAAGDLGELGFAVASFGVFAAPGAPASAHAVTTMSERGLDLSRHGSTHAAPEALSTFDEIYGLTRSHVQAIVGALPPRLAERVALLDPRGSDVADPVGGSLLDYRACAEQIEAALDLRLADWV